jgi:hypothetical protein
MHAFFFKKKVVGALSFIKEKEAKELQTRGYKTLNRGQTW